MMSHDLKNVFLLLNQIQNNNKNNDYIISFFLELLNLTTYDNFIKWFEHYSLASVTIYQYLVNISQYLNIKLVNHFSICNDSECIKGAIYYGNLIIEHLEIIKK